MGQGGAGQFRRREEVHVHDRAQHVFGRPGEVAEAADAGGVHEQIQPAEVPHRRFDQPQAVLVDRDIRHLRDRVREFGCELL